MLREWHPVRAGVEENLIGTIDMSIPKRGDIMTNIEIGVTTVTDLPHIMTTGPPGNIEKGPPGNIETDPPGNIKIDPTENMEIEPPENIKTDPQESIETDPQESIETDPQESIETDPQESIETDPRESIETDPREIIEKDPPENMMLEPQENIEIVPQEITMRDQETAKKDLPEAMETDCSKPPETSMKTGLPETSMKTGLPETSMKTGHPETSMKTGLPETTESDSQEITDHKNLDISAQKMVLCLNILTIRASAQKIVQETMKNLQDPDRKKLKANLGLKRCVIYVQKLK